MLLIPPLTNHFSDTYHRVRQRGWRLREIPIPALTFADEKKSLLVCGYTDGLIQLLDRISGHLVRTFTGHERYISRLLCSAVPHRLVSAAEDGLRVWNLATGDCVSVIVTQAQSVEWAGDFERIATGSQKEQAIRIWSIVDG